MSKSKILQSVLASYFVILVMIVWSPVSPDSGSLLGVFRFNEGLEKFLNFLLLTPLSVLLKVNFERVPLFLLAVIGPLISATIEVGQFFIPGRVSDLLDLALNSTGYLITLFLYQKINSHEAQGMAESKGL